MDTPDETNQLISAGKVSGTPVYSTEGNNLGEIYDVMLDKRSGRIAYAVMSVGGMLGIGTRYHPLPWQSLKYDMQQGGYVVGIPVGVLERAPNYAANETPNWGDAAFEKSILDYYQTA